MPEFDGYSAAKMIRAMKDKIRQTIPIVALTAGAMTVEKAKIKSSGMNGYQTKPL